jgi:hypothetical protein
MHVDQISIPLVASGSALHIDERYIAVGHVDGSVTLFDRISSLQMTFPCPFEDSETEPKTIIDNKRIITWMARHKDCIATASQSGA